MSPAAYATANNVNQYPIQPFNHYDNLEHNTPGGSTVTNTAGNLEEANRTAEDIKIEEFNGSFLDTTIYIIGGLSGIMMLLQITAFAICKLFPSWNHLVAKLSKIGISGYEDGWLAPTIKILLLGILGYLCISGTMKHLIAYILGWYTNIIHFD